MNNYYDERKCLGIDCAWCLDTSCVLSKTNYKNEVKQMIKWYEDKNLIIEFDKVPDADVSFPMPFYGKDRNKAICNKPFINKEPLNVKLTWLGEVFTFDVPSGYEWDGASIPKLFFIYS